MDGWNGGKALTPVPRYPTHRRDSGVDQPGGARCC